MSYICYFILMFALFQEMRSINLSMNFNSLEKIGIRLIIFTPFNISNADYL